MKQRLVQLAVALGAVIVTVIAWMAPNQLMTDSLGTLAVSQAILEHGTVSLEPYKETHEGSFVDWGYVYQFYETEEGEILYAYPLGNSFVALPAVWLANRLGYDMLAREDALAWHHGLAALTLGACFLLIYALSRIWLPPGYSLGWALVMALGTALASTMGTVIWGHTGLFVWSLLALWLLLDPRFAAWKAGAFLGGVCLFMVFISRPQGALIIAGLLGYLLLWDRRRLLWAIAGSLPPLLLFLAIFYPFYGEIPGMHYYWGLSFSFSWAYVQTLFGDLLFSPSRGLFIYSSVLLVALVMAVMYGRRLPNKPAALLGCGIVAAYLALVASWEYWGGAWSYGPRLQSDSLPGWALLGALALAAWREDPLAIRRGLCGAAFVVSAAVSGWMNTIQGLHNEAVIMWNSVVEMPQNSEVFRDWDYPQFLASDARNAEQKEAYKLQGIPPVPLGTEVPADHAALVFEDGWYGLEKTQERPFRWASAGPNRLKLAPGLWRGYPAGKPLRLEFFLTTFGPQRIEVKCEGQLLAEWTNEGQATAYVLQVPPRMWEPGRHLTLNFEGPDARRPSETNGSTDTRPLGPLFLSVRVLPTE